MTTGERLAEQVDGTRKWLLMLLSDLAHDDWTYQPANGVQHALWLCGHCASSQDTLVFARCLERSELDPDFKKLFAPGGPIKPKAVVSWPSPEEVKGVMAEMHAKTLAAIRGMSDEFLNEPAYGKDGATHPHYDTKLGAIGHLDRHEAFHAGQIALIRRLLGKSFLR